MVKRWGKNGWFLACSKYPSCKFTKPINNNDSNLKTGENEAKFAETGEICDKCGSKMVIKVGRYGRFLACSNYPTCKFTKSISTGCKCPEENCDGVILEKRTRKGRIFYGCSNYPNCKFATWNKPVQKTCKECGNTYMEEITNKNGTTSFKCPVCGTTSTEEKQ